jgi:P27 family predicted phage terminase small subunit
MKNSLKPPSDLSFEAKKLWKSIQAEYGIEDATGITYLDTGCRFFARMREAQATIAREGAVVKDRFDQLKPHPAAIIERDAASSMIKAFRQLNLDVEPLKTIGRPPGR